MKYDKCIHCNTPFSEPRSYFIGKHCQKDFSTNGFRSNVLNSKKSIEYIAKASDSLPENVKDILQSQLKSQPQALNYFKMISSLPTERKDYHMYSQKIPIELIKKVQRKPQGQGGSISLSKEELDLIVKHGKYGIMSADISDIDKQNKISKGLINERKEKFEKYLIENGYIFCKGEGKYRGDSEETYLIMIHDIEPKDMSLIGRENNQNSVIYSNNGESYMIDNLTGYNKEIPIDSLSKMKTIRNLSPEVNDDYSCFKTSSGENYKFTFDDFTDPVRLIDTSQYEESTNNINEYLQFFEKK